MLKKMLGLCRRVFSASAELDLKKITVIGCGIMGSGIAQAIAQNQYQVNIVGVNKELLEKSGITIKKSLEKISKKKYKNPSDVQEVVESILKNINFTTELESSIDSSDLIIEAVTENLKLKQEIFKTINQMIGHDSPKILTTNTSSLSVKDISLHVLSKRNFAGLHFFNPVPIMGLVEVVQTENTAPEVIEKLKIFSKNLGKEPIICKDTPGFIVNRLLVPFLIEAIRLLERGDADVRSIDQAMKLGASHPMGPLELADYVGLDTVKFIIDGWSERFPENAEFKTPKLLNSLVKENKLGKKSGEGFYKY